MIHKMSLLSVVIVFLASATISAAPANPNATPEAKALLQYLVNLGGQKILSGQESMWNDGSGFPSTRDQYVYQRTNKYPALYTSDFGDFGTGNLSDRNKVVSNAIAYHKKGSIIAFQYHMIQPDLADGSGFSAMNIKGSTYSKIPDILTTGNSLNTEFNKRLDAMAGYFKTLQDSSIAVLWRPFHEMNGDWFWWSYQDRFKDLWTYTFNYLTTTKKCNNLLWVFGVNWYSNGSTGKATPEYYYPGHQYVDVLGCDFYTEYGHSYDKRVHDALRTLGGGKPIAIAENGTMPDLSTLLTEQPYWVYWSTWWGFEGSGKGNTDALYTKNYGLAAVITQDEVSIAPVSIFSFSPASRTIEDPGFAISNRSNALSLISSGSFDRLALYTIAGRQAAAAYGNRGIFTFDNITAGTYLVRACGTGGANTVKLTVKR
jgi:mannan endo-1,4-beta-mannosidase